MDFEDLEGTRGLKPLQRASTFDLEAVQHDGLDDRWFAARAVVDEVPTVLFIEPVIIGVLALDVQRELCVPERRNEGLTTALPAHSLDIVRRVLEVILRVEVPHEKLSLLPEVLLQGLRIW